MGIAPEKSDHAILGVNGDTVAISVLFGRWDDRPHGNVFQFADPLQNIADLAPFNGELMFVIDVLIRAAAAAAKIWARWGNAVR